MESLDAFTGKPSFDPGTLFKKRWARSGISRQTVETCHCAIQHSHKSFLQTRALSSGVDFRLDFPRQLRGSPQASTVPSAASLLKT